MPKRTTTAAITLLTNDAGRVQLALNAKAAPGGTITEWSVDWDDGETEDHTEPLPGTVEHAYITPGAVLIVLTVKDAKGKVVSEGLNAIVQPAPMPVPPEEGTFDALMPPSDSGLPFEAKSWQYQALAAPFVITATRTPSADGTTIVAPTGHLIAVDQSVWTWGEMSAYVGQYYVLRNAINTAGISTVMKACHGVIYHLGGDGRTWWHYVDGSIVSAGTVEPCANVTP